MGLPEPQHLPRGHVAHRNLGADMSTLRITVDPTHCGDYGQCCFEAPTVFRLNSDGHLEYSDMVDAALLDQVENAADACPMQAISVSA